MPLSSSSPGAGVCDAYEVVGWLKDLVARDRIELSTLRFSGFRQFMRERGRPILTEARQDKYGRSRPSQTVVFWRLLQAVAYSGFVTCAGRALQLQNDAQT